MRRATSLGLVAVVVLVIGLLAAGATPAAADTTNSQNITAEEIATEWTLTELQRGGASIEASPNSVRATDEQMYWVIHWPASLLSSGVGDPSSDGWKYLERGETVERNSIYLRTINQGEAEELTVTVAIYDEGEREVTEGNQTTTVNAPTNLEVFQHDITLDRGWAIAEINLPQTDAPRQVTMWVEGAEDDLRWTFEHDSVATTQPIAIDTWGDFLTSSIFYFLGPILIGGFGAGSTAKRAIQRAGIGPQWGYGKWIVLLAIIAGAAVFALFTSFAQFVVNLPWILSAFVVLVIGIIILETYTSNVELYGFFQPTLSYTEGPDEEGMVDIINAEGTKEFVVKMHDNTIAVVRPGLLPFLSRCFGGAARLEGADQIETAVDMENWAIDKMFFIDPAAEKPLEYEPEGWTWELPSTDVCPHCGSVGIADADEDADGSYLCGTCEAAFDAPESTFKRGDLLKVGVVGAAMLVTGFTVFTLSGSTALGLIAGVIPGIAIGATPTNGYARFEPAEGMTRKVFASMMYMRIKHDEIETWKDARDRILEEKANAVKEREQLVSESSESLAMKLLDEEVDTSLTEFIEDEVDTEALEEVLADD